MLAMRSDQASRRFPAQNGQEVGEAEPPRHMQGMQTTYSIAFSAYNAFAKLWRTRNDDGE
ncbi:hypothetical protein [Paenibacillus sp. HB172176]|uniref:hypothetical protein n=1 Tax=Paenibacillus sp. HB172176 TaxID=2493690 RepID=UPI001439A743|nr:hypothetical protein [Paenibacillus sp. HB172176]